MAVQCQYRVSTIDVSTAFLQREESDLGREISLEPPRDYWPTKGKLHVEPPGKDCIWKMKKAAYGMNKAPRAWVTTVRRWSIKHGCYQLKGDPSVLYSSLENKTPSKTKMTPMQSFNHRNMHMTIFPQKDLNRLLK